MAARRVSNVRYAVDVKPGVYLNAKQFRRQQGGRDQIFFTKKEKENHAAAGEAGFWVGQPTEIGCTA